MVSFEFIKKRSFSKTKFDYLIQYLYYVTDLPLFEILSIKSVSSFFTDLENFEFVYEVVYIDDFMVQNSIRVVLLPDLSASFFEVF